MKRPPVFLWKYEPPNKNFSGYHLTGESSGFESIKMRLTGPLYSTENLISMTIPLSIPTERETEVPGCRSKAVPFTKLKISVNSTAEKWFMLSEEGSICLLDISESMLPALFKGFEDVLAGSGDYSIGEDGNELWFWWR